VTERREPEKMYTEEEANHMIAREVAKQRMNDLERNLNQTTTAVVQNFAKFDAKMDAIAQQVSEIGSRDYLLRDDVERDFSKFEAKMDRLAQIFADHQSAVFTRSDATQEFVTKLTMAQEVHSLNSSIANVDNVVKGLVIKLTTIVSTITILGLFANYYINFAKVITP